MTTRMVLGVVFILCTITYRSLTAGFMFVFSLVLANFFAFSYMVYRNIGLNINTLPIVSVGVGVGLCSSVCPCVRASIS